MSAWTPADPNVTIYNEISLDGKITGFNGDGIRYYRRGFRWRNDAILMGSVTAEAFGPQESPADQRRDLPALDPAPILPGFDELVSDPRPLLVVPDSRGRLRNWRHALAQPWYGQILVLVSESTPPEYLNHLDRRGIEHLLVGSDAHVDLPLALRELHQTYSVTSIRTDAGGALNGALLASGLVDRITVIIAPQIGRGPGAQGLIRLPFTAERPTVLTMIESELLADGALWLTYDVTAAADH